MVKRRIQLRNVSNVAASKTALIEIPCGPRYHYIVLEHGYSSGTNTIAAAATNISEVRVKLNGRIQRIYSGTQLRDLNLLYGTAFDCQGVPNTAPGVSFPLYFSEPWREDPKDRDALAWQTKGFQSFQVEIDLGAATSPTLVAHAAIDEFDAGTVGIVKHLRQSFAAAGTSFDISQLDRRDWYQQISLYPDSGGSNAPSKVTLRKDGVILHELTASSNKALLLNNQMTPAASGRTANVYDLVLDHDDLLGSAVPADGSRDMTLTVEAASAMSGTTVAIIQRLGPPE
jgi:hypothetical protein